MSKAAGLRSLGVDFDRLTFADLCAAIDRHVARRQRIVVGYVNLHGAYLARRDPFVRRFFAAADLLYADGTPIILWRRLLWGDARADNRFTLSQEFPTLMRLAVEKGWRLFYLGSRPHVVEAAAHNLRAEFAGVELKVLSGFFDRSPGSGEADAVVRAINGYGPHILFVGMGMPAQERWILENADRLDCPVIYATGAAIEYFSGHVARAPRWVSQYGFEWVHRLLHEPRKLWFRYVVEPLFLIPVAVKEVAARVLRVR